MKLYDLGSTIAEESAHIASGRRTFEFEYMLITGGFGQKNLV